MPQPTTIAEKMRAHREAFTLALELGCTPREAEKELRRRRAWADHEDLLRRAAAKLAAPAPRATASTTATAPDDRWMMRD